jgi:hypothetical protein
MTRDKLKDKFRKPTATVLTEKHAENIIGVIGELEKLDNLSDLSAPLISD